MSVNLCWWVVAGGSLVAVGIVDIFVGNCACIVVLVLGFLFLELGLR